MFSAWSRDETPTATPEIRVPDVSNCVVKGIRLELFHRGRRNLKVF